MEVDQDIDSETLQAQIDLSLSYAQNLVSSWVKPSNKPTKASSHAFEAELKEYMRRPPRLGVGADIPAVSTSSKDAERLKSRLSGKNKRTRGQDDDSAAPKDLDDDEDDGRGASTKKKARTDPFDAHSRKKKKKETDTLQKKSPLRGPAESIVPDTPRQARSPPPDPKIATEEVLMEQSTPLADVSMSDNPLPKPKKKKKKHKNKESAGAAADTPLVEAPQSPEGPSRQAASALVDTTASGPEVSEDVPLLFLDGPPANNESEDEGEPDSPKKKRRRKKKKKKTSLAPAPQI
ncbi:hypothetical protein C8F01DRAFT_1118297 [Mycena amicta]|nr:hypothetical protein C8F01DRAFT_1118297 [Mycena amicta]